MTALPPITILIEPPRAQAPSAAEGQWGDELARYRELAEALRQHTPAKVSVERSFLRDAPPGLVLVRPSDYQAMMNEIEPDFADGTRTITNWRKPSSPPA